MKKFLLLTGILLTLFNCSNEIEFNEHAFQATKDNKFWKASDFSVEIKDDGFISLVGNYQDEMVHFNIERAEAGVYVLGENSNSTAWFTDGKGNGFTTEYRGNGEIIIEKFDPIAQTFSGTFKFNAFSADGEVVNFVKGVFYQVPVVETIFIEEEGELKASVGESELTAEDVIVNKAEGVIEIDGIASDGSFIKLYIPESTTVGSYNLNEQSNSGTYAIYGFSNGDTSIAQYGTLFVDEHNLASGLIKGSFSFTTLLPNSVSVENGSFRVQY